MLSRSCKNAWAAVRRWARPQSTVAAATPSASTSTSAVTPEVERQWAASVVHGRSLTVPYQHPRTHNIPVALIHFRSYHPDLIKQFTHFSLHAAAALGIPTSRAVPLPTQRSLWTVPRGPFAHKKSQENFERRVHKRVVKAWDTHPEVVDRWVRYLEEHAMAGVGIRVVRWHRAPVGVGQKVLEGVMGRIRMDAATRAEKVKALGEKIVQQELAAGSAQKGVDAPSS